MSKKKIVAAVNIRFSSSRELVSGIFNRMDRGLDWEFDFAMSADDLHDRIAAARRGDGADGFIISYFLDDETVNGLLGVEASVVTVGVHDVRLRRRSAKTVEIHNDGYAIGRIASDYLTHLGKFASRAFVHLHTGREYGHSDERLSGVGKAEVFESPFPEGSDEDNAALGRFLAELPKPAAVIAAHDKRALDVLRVSRDLGLRVPRDVSVVGIDNDQLFCSHCSPPLTSVHPGHFDMGYKAADELDKLLRSRAPAKSIRILKVPPVRIVERESTRAPSPAETLVRRAEEFINANASKGISPSDVVAHLKCSRALLYLRFGERTNSTLRQAIENRRLKEAQRLLKSTRRSLKSIAVQCGFSSECRMSHLFSQRLGRSPTSWREEFGLHCR